MKNIDKTGEKTTIKKMSEQKLSETLNNEVILYDKLSSEATTNDDFSDVISSLLFQVDLIVELYSRYAK